MTRRLSRVERSCLDAMLNAPRKDDATTVAAGTEVLVANGMLRSDAAKVAQGLYDECLKIYPPN